MLDRLINLTLHPFRIHLFNQKYSLDQFLKQMIEILNTLQTEWVLWPSTEEVWQVIHKPLVNTFLQQIPSNINIVSVFDQHTIENSPSIRTVMPIIQPLLWRRDWLKNQLAHYNRQIPDVAYIGFDIAINTNFSTQYILEYLQSVGIKKLDKNCRQDSLYFKPALQFILPILMKHAENNAIKIRQPKISIILCAYNEAARIGWAIRSVLQQIYTNWELIVIDDGSSDGTHSVVQSFSDHRIILKQFYENRGKAFALNEALNMIQGSFALELDADDWLPQNSLSEFVNALPSIDDTVGIITGSYFLWFRSSQGRLLFKAVEKPTNLMVTPKLAKPIIPRFYRTDVLKKLNGWPILDGPLSRLYEDIAICLRIQTQYQTYYIDKPLYHRVIRTSSISQKNRSKYSEWLQKYNELFPTENFEL